MKTAPDDLEPADTERLDTDPARRVALVAINYYPEQVGIGVTSTGLAEYLARRGMRVTAYTGFPYYPAWTKQSEDTGKLFGCEERNGVTIRRSYLWVPARPSALRRILHEASFVASAALNYLVGPRAGCTIVFSPPLPLGVPLALLARLKGSRVVLHVQDLQPDTALELGMLGGRWFARALFALEKITYRVAHCVCTISDDMRDRIVSKGVPASKVFVHRNGADDEKVMPASPQTPLRHEWGLEDKLVVLYAGNLGVKQGLHTLLDAAARLAGQREIAFVIVGDGGEKERLVERARQLALENVIFRPLQPPERLRELLATADIAVIPQRGVVRDVVFPTKVAYIMCSARPIVAAVVADGELARVLHQADCGVVVEPENPSALAAAIVALARAPEERVRLGRNGRSYAERHLSHRAVFGHFADRIAALSALGNRRPKRAVAAPAHRNLALTGSDPARTIFPGDEQPCD